MAAAASTIASARLERLVVVARHLGDHEGAAVSLEAQTSRSALPEGAHVICSLQAGGPARFSFDDPSEILEPGAQRVGRVQPICRLAREMSIVASTGWRTVPGAVWSLPAVAKHLEHGLGDLAHGGGMAAADVDGSVNAAGLQGRDEGRRRVADVNLGRSGARCFPSR